jgi:hypothetical protein
MDNSSLSKSIMETIQNTNGSNMNTGNTSSPTVSTPNTSSAGFLGSLFSVSLTTWIIIILILAFLGFNIFIYLAKGTQEFTDIVKPLVDKVASLFGATTKQIANNSATGAKGTVDSTANVLDSGLTKVQDATQGKKAESTAGGTTLQNSIPHADVTQNNTLNKTINTNTTKQNIGSTKDYVADDSTSSIQKPQTKGGYCYIGEERGNRSCMRIDDNDTCMSGKIFPTRELCLNPK